MYMIINALYSYIHDHMYMYLSHTTCTCTNPLSICTFIQYIHTCTCMCIFCGNIIIYGIINALYSYITITFIIQYYADSNAFNCLIIQPVHSLLSIPSLLVGHANRSGLVLNTYVGT